MTRRARSPSTWPRPTLTSCTSSPWSFVAPAPPGTPDGVISRAPFLPGTGPYMISQFTPNKSVTLVRNPYFRQWSYAAQPAGYPSVIRYERMASLSRQESAVIAGRADLALLLSGDDQSLAVRYPARVHVGLRLGTGYASLNTRLPPFTNIKARQAVNYAIDRARIIQLDDFAPGQATATCQMLPPDFPGHQGYCPYTTGAGDGAWHGPDMAKARRLVRESGTTNAPVTVWSFNNVPGKAAGSYLVGLLDDLGYRASLHAVSEDRFWTDLYNPRLKIQVSIGGRMGRRLPLPVHLLRPPAELPVGRRARHQQLGQVLRSSRRRAGQPGAGRATHRPRRSPQAVGPGRPHRHRPGTLRPDPQRRNGRIRLLPGRELPGIPGVRTPARPDVGPVTSILNPRLTLLPSQHSQARHPTTSGVT